MQYQQYTSPPLTVQQIHQLQQLQVQQQQQLQQRLAQGSAQQQSRAGGRGASHSHCAAQSCGHSIFQHASALLSTSQRCPNVSVFLHELGSP